MMPRPLPARRLYWVLALLLLLGATALLLLAAPRGAGVGGSLLLAQPLAQMPDLGDYAWNALAGNEIVATLLWLLVVEVVGLLAWPLLAIVCRWLPDRGYPLSKALGLLLLCWPVWIGASTRLVPFTFWSLIGSMLLLAFVSIVAVRRYRAELREFVTLRWRLLLAWEVTFLSAFALFIGLRLLNPDLWLLVHPGEKPMDFGFLNATLRSAWMPPPDPFFAGGTINYYYYGQFIVACLIKLIGVAPAVGYNLALPTLYALLVVGVGSVVSNAVAAWEQQGAEHATVGRRAFGWGLVGVALVAVAGNLHGGLQLLSIWLPSLYSNLLALFHSWGLTAPAMSVSFDYFQYWPTSRITPRTINEFPYWIFLFGDLHAHLIGLPFTLLMLGLILNLSLGAWRSRADVGKSGLLSTMLAALPAATPGGNILLAALLSLTLGGLAVINSWDFITYAALLAAAVGLSLVVRLRWMQERITPRQVFVYLAAGGLWFGIVATLALLAYSPFFLNFKSFYNQIRPIVEEAGMRRTQVAEWLVIWGLFAYITVGYVVAGLRRYPWAAAWDGLRRVAGRFSQRQYGPQMGLVRGEGSMDLTPNPSPTRRGAFGYVVLERSLVSPDLPSPRRRGVGGEVIEPSQQTGLFPPLVGPMIIGVTLLIAATYAVRGQGLVSLLFVLVGLLLALLLCAARSPGMVFTGLLLLTGVALTLGVELFYLADFLQDTEWFRMNTVFKFYMQAWILLGVGGALALSWLFTRPRAKGSSRALPRLLWLVGLAPLVLAAASFVLLGTGSRLDESLPSRPPGPTLDGMAFMESNTLTWGPITSTITVDLRYERDAYGWLISNTAGLPVIATAPTDPDPAGEFVATFTGLPVVIGSLHQEEQRYPEQVAARRADMRELFRTTDGVRASELLRKYDVTYLYVGAFEHWLMAETPGAMEKFAVLPDLEVVYQNPGVTIYKVRPVSATR